MAMVNPMLNPLQMKDSRWLTLEVCREFQRNKCTRPETECKFAHPPPHVEVQNGRVTCCFDSIKGKCQRKDPPCKYLHPPQHLREQLLQNGRNNLILKNLQVQAMAAAGLQPMVPGMIPAAVAHPQYITAAAMPNAAAFNPYGMPGHPVSIAGMVPTIDTTAPVTVSGGGGQVQGVAVPPGVSPSQKVSRADRLEPTTSGSTSSGSGSDPTWSGAYVDSLGGAAVAPAPSSHYSHVYFQGMSAVPGMVPMVKRPAGVESKSGIPMYQPGSGTTAYQQAALAMQLQQQPYIPVTNGTGYQSWLTNGAVAGHPPSVPRF